MLLSALAYCGDASPPSPDAAIGPRCQETLQCLPQSLESQCQQASVYAVLPLDKASDECLSEFDPWPFWFPFGHYGVNHSGYVEISRCNFEQFEGRKLTHRLVDNTVHRRIGSEGSIAQTASGYITNLTFYCSIPCNKDRIDIGTVTLPEGSTAIIDSGIRIQLDERSKLYTQARKDPHLMYALEFQENNPEGGSFFVRYCVLSR